MSKNIKALQFLLAEDSADQAELIIDSLKGFNIGNQIAHVTDGEDLLKFVRRESPFEQETFSPDLILLDIKMPRMNGIEALQAIREDPLYAHLPVIMISTSSYEKDIKRCFELGANSYLTKPFDFDEFTQKIRDLNLYWVLTSELPS